MAIISSVTVEDVRVRSGEAEERLTDAQITTLIEDGEKDVETYLNSKLQGTLTIDHLDGSADNIIALKHGPVLGLVSVQSDDSLIDADEFFVEVDANAIIIRPGSSIGVFTYKTKKVSVKYYYGYLEASTTQTTTSAEASAGSSVAISVASETGFSTGDWVSIKGMDYEERAKITGTDTEEITVETLNFTHASGSIVTLLEIPKTVEELIIIEAAIKVAQAMLSLTARDKSRYRIDDVEIALGEAYAQWNAMVKSLKVGLIKAQKRVRRISYVTR